MVLGMPVMFTQNFNVQAGVVNGSTGILKQIRYQMDTNNKQHVVSAWVTSSQHAASVAAMNYANYKDSIMQSQKCKIIGYPSDVPFVSPSLL